MATLAVRPPEIGRDRSDSMNRSCDRLWHAPLRRTQDVKDECERWMQLTFEAKEEAKQVQRLQPMPAEPVRGALGACKGCDATQLSHDA